METLGFSFGVNKLNPELWKALRSPTGYRTRSLFADVQRHLRQPEDYNSSPYWLERKNYTEDDPRPVMKEHYIASMDPTGYETALKFLGSYDHWEYMIKNCAWFREAVADWKQILEARIKSKAIAKIQEIAFSEDKQALGAAKYLATLDYEKTDGRGRPSTAEKTGKLKEAIMIAEAEREDMERIGLSVIKGGKK